MKKFLLLMFIFMFSVTTAFAVDWTRLNAEVYVDSSSITETTISNISGMPKFREGWIKLLNNGDWGLEKGQKVGYVESYIIAQCNIKPKRYKSVSILSYSLQDKILNSESISNINYIYDRNSFDIPTPNSKAESAVDYICSYPVGGSSVRYIQVDSYTYERPYHY